ncbi:MAG: peptidylprolyl isomerase [Chloroflexota bacterium]
MSRLRLIAYIAVAMVIGACSSTTATETAPQTNNTSNTENSSNADTTGLAASVNGVGITIENYNTELTRRSSVGVADTNALSEQVLTELIEQELINQGAPALGITITDADVDTEIAEQRDIAGSDQAWRDSLAMNGYTEDQWYGAQRNVLITLGVRNVLLEPYLGEVEQVNARHILVRTEDEANEVLDRLESGTDGFATLAAEYSLDVTTADVGGNLGWFARNELFYRSLEDSAFTLEIGSVSYVSTPLGYHVLEPLAREIRVIEPSRLTTLSENVFNRWLDEQYQSATVEVYIQW